MQHAPNAVSLSRQPPTTYRTANGAGTGHGKGSESRQVHVLRSVYTIGCRAQQRLRPTKSAIVCIAISFRATCVHHRSPSLFAGVTCACVVEALHSVTRTHAAKRLSRTNLHGVWFAFLCRQCDTAAKQASHSRGSPSPIAIATASHRARDGTSRY